MLIYDYKKLHIFHILSQTGSFTKTANKVNLSQAAVSYAVKNLEKALDCVLFERSTKSVTLTEEGELLLKHVMSIQQTLEIAEEEVRSVNSSSKTIAKLKVGASVATSIYFVEKIWPSLKEKYPQLELDLKPGDTEHLLDFLKNGTINMLVGVNVSEMSKQKSYTFHELFIDEKVIAFHPDHSFAKNTTLSASDLSGQTMIIGTRHSPTKKLIDRYLNVLENPIDQLFDVRSLSLQKEMLKLNMGVGIVSPFMFRNEFKSKSLLYLPMPNKPIVRSWGVMVRSDYKPSEIEQEMVKMLIKTTKVFR